MIFTEINLCRPGYLYISIWMAASIVDVFVLFLLVFKSLYFNVSLILLPSVMCLGDMCLFWLSFL